MKTRRILSVIFAVVLVGGVAFAEPPTEIVDVSVRIELDHDQGEIDALTYTYGSGRDLLDQHFEHGLGRLHGLGEMDDHETGTILQDYDVDSGHAYFFYVNGAYGSKMIDITWSISGGIEVVMAFNFDAYDEGRYEGAMWEPGGSNNPHDFASVLEYLESKNAFPYQYQYPGPWTLIWEGNAYGTVMWDEEYNERFGYRTPCYMWTTLAEGTCAIGPHHQMQLAGTYMLYFAVKTPGEFDAWFDSFPMTGDSCDDALTLVAGDPGVVRPDRLGQNVPNPFNPETAIAYELAAPGPVRLSVFDVQGRLVRLLVDEVQQAGPHGATWDGRDAAGEHVTPGIYFYRMETERAQTMKKMVLVK